MEVTPHVGVWIETSSLYAFSNSAAVTPHVGVWIETIHDLYCQSQKRSPPMWGCGLKLYVYEDMMYLRRHPPCGGVD